MKSNYVNFITTNLLILISAFISYIICCFYFDNPFLNQTLFALTIVLANYNRLKLNFIKSAIWYISMINLIFFFSIFFSFPIAKIFKSFFLYIIFIIDFILIIYCTKKIIEINTLLSVLLALIISPLPYFLTKLSNNYISYSENPWTVFFWLQITLGLILTIGINTKK